jgi:hypothetical protein
VTLCDWWNYHKFFYFKAVWYIFFLQYDVMDIVWYINVCPYNILY